MIDKDIRIGNFEPFLHGVEIAELKGTAVERACGMLALLPPFRDKEEALSLDFETAMKARRKAVVASGLMDVANATAEIDDSVDKVVFSKTGALAVRTGGVEFELFNECREIITEWDGGNPAIFADTHVVNINLSLFP